MQNKEYFFKSDPGKRKDNMYLFRLLQISPSLKTYPTYSDSLFNEKTHMHIFIIIYHIILSCKVVDSD